MSEPLHVARSIAAGLRQVVRTLGVCLAVALALMTFPNAVPWMIACWLLCHTVLVIRGRRGWVPLAACAAILLVKRVPWTIGLLLLGSVAVVAVAMGFSVRRRGTAAWRRGWAAIGVVGLWMAWGVAAADWHLAAWCSRRPVLDPAQPVVCIGDSLTSMGDRRAAYPERLADLIVVPVVNLGCPGIDTIQGLQAAGGPRRAPPGRRRGTRRPRLSQGVHPRRDQGSPGGDHCRLPRGRRRGRAHGDSAGIHDRPFRRPGARAWPGSMAWNSCPTRPSAACSWRALRPRPACGPAGHI